MKGVVICGQSCVSLGEVLPEGGSQVVTVNLVAMAPGLFHVKGCFVVDMESAMEIQQPALFSVFVDDDHSHQ